MQQSYYQLLAPAVARLDRNTGQARCALYDRARAALADQLHSLNAPLNDFDIIRERLALEDAICMVEVKYRLAKVDHIQPKPSKRAGMVNRILRALRLTQPAEPAARRSGRPEIERQIHEWTSPAPKRLYELPRLTAGHPSVDGRAHHPPTFQLGAG
jgi:hypothetical protein